MYAQLGKRGKDKVTGFSGLIMGHIEYLTGCHQTLLTPTELDKDGKRRDGEWFDDVRVEVLEENSISLTDEHPGADEARPLREKSR